MKITHDATKCVTLLRRVVLWSVVCLLPGCVLPATSPLGTEPQASTEESTEGTAAPAKTQSVPVRLLPDPPPDAPPDAPLRTTRDTPVPNGDSGSNLLDGNAPADELEITLRNMLLGQEEAQVRDIFGAPQSETLRSPGKVWSYDSSRCVMDIFLYLDIRTNTFRVLTLDVTAPPTSETCDGRLADSDS